MSRNPAITDKVPVLECSPKCASGINSSTTTYIIAPAAKAKSQGINGAINPANTITAQYKAEKPQ